MKLRFEALVALAFAFPLHAVTCNNTIPPTNPDDIYTVHADGTVTDTRTGLMWKQCEEGRSGSDCSGGSRTTHNWANALALAQASSFAGYTDWRLPNIKELASLVELCRHSPAINETIFPNTASLVVWSGSPAAFNSSYAWGVIFGHGYGLYSSQGYAYGVRLVRSGQ